MINRKIIYFLVIYHIFPAGNKATSQRFFSKLVNQSQSSNGLQNTDKKYKSIEGSHAELKCKYKCITPNVLGISVQTRNQARFIDHETDDVKMYNKSNDDKNNEMEPPTSKFSIFNLLSDDEEGDDNLDDEEKLKTEEDDEEEEEEEEEEGEEDGDDGEDEQGDGVDDVLSFNFFDPDEEINLEKLEGTNGENLLKQYRRHRRRIRNMVFPLLLAYKLKFFTVIPLLLGSLVLLIGSTGIAGFFFALFAAALGIHVKMEQH